MDSPVRQCVVCHIRSAKSELLRVVKTGNGQVILDSAQKQNGRGLYFCKQSKCLIIARKRKVLERKFSADINPEIYISLAREVVSSEQKSADSFIGLAVKSGKAVLGFSSVINSIHRNEAILVVLSKTVKVNTKNRIIQAAKRARIQLIIHTGQKELEDLTGQANLKCIGILDALIAEQIVKYSNI